MGAGGKEQQQAEQRTFVIEAIDAIDRGAFVVAAKQRYMRGEARLEAHQQLKALDAVVATVDKIAGAIKTQGKVSITSVTSG